MASQGRDGSEAAPSGGSPDGVSMTLPSLDALDVIEYSLKSLSTRILTDRRPKTPAEVRLLETRIQSVTTLLSDLKTKANVTPKAPPRRIASTKRVAKVASTEEKARVMEITSPKRSMQQSAGKAFTFDDISSQPIDSNVKPNDMPKLGDGEDSDDNEANSNAIVHPAATKYMSGPPSTAPKEFSAVPKPASNLLTTLPNHISPRTKTGGSRSRFSFNQSGSVIAPMNSTITEGAVLALTDTEEETNIKHLKTTFITGPSGDTIASQLSSAETGDDTTHVESDPAEQPRTKAPRLTIAEKAAFKEKMSAGGIEVLNQASRKISETETNKDEAQAEAAGQRGRRRSVGSYLLSKARAREAFMMLDRNGDGFLRKEDVYEALHSLHFDERFNEMESAQNFDGAMEVVEKMIKEIDKDGDGRVDLDEFVSVLTAADSHGRASQLQSRMSMLAHNVVAAHKKKEETAMIGKSKWLIHPNNELHTFFDLLVAFLIILTIITMPLCIAWDEVSDGMSGFNLAVDIIFLIDIVKNFNTGFINVNDDTVMDRRTVIVTYLKGWFIIDLISSIPIEHIVEQNNESQSVASANSSLKGLKLLKIAKVLRLFKLTKTFRWIRMLSLKIEERLQWRMSDGTLKLTKLAIYVLLAAHWLACFQWFICRQYDFPEDSWVVKSDLDPLAMDRDPERYPPLEKNPTFLVQYNWSFFKAMAQMIMIGFETPPFTNVSCEVRSEWCSIETWITLLCLYIGTVFYALLISNTSTIIMQLNQAKRQFEEKLQAVNEYMRDKKLPSTLREKVRDYYHLQYSEGKIFDETGILAELAPSLRSEILRYNSRELYQKVPVFCSSPYSFTAAIANNIRPEIAFADEDVFVEGTTGDTIYFIYRGIAEIRSKLLSDAAFTAIGDGCYFGDVAVFLGEKRSATVRTRTLCVMYTVEGPDIKDALVDFPEIAEYMAMVARKRKERLMALDPKADIVPEDDNVIDDEDSKTDLFSENLGVWDGAKVNESPHMQPRRGSKFQNDGTGLKITSGGSNAANAAEMRMQDRRKSRTAARRRVSELAGGFNTTPKIKGYRSIQRFGPQR